MRRAAEVGSYTAHMSEPVDLGAYLARIEYRGSVAPDLETLRAVHLAHATHIPFENLDILMGRPILLDLESLVAKLVHRRRGGYCFEQNTLFQHVLQAFGFEVIPCEARVRQGAEGQVRPRTHMLLVVRLGGEDWLCDVGFGGDGLLEPLLLDGREHEESGRLLGTVRQGREVILQSRWDENTEDLYAFVPEPRFPIDFEAANWFTSTWPASGFRKTLTVQKTLPEARHILRRLTYSVRAGRSVQTREIPRSGLPHLLRGTFGLDLPDDTRYMGLDD